MTTASPDQESLYLHISDPPYENFFYADHTVSCQVVLASPLPRADIGSTIQHRLLVAWPAGNSGAAVFFKSADSDNPSLSIKLRETSERRVLAPYELVSKDRPTSNNPSVGVSGILSFSESAILNLAILGSVRTVRDYTEGHGILNSKVQEAVRFEQVDSDDSAVTISRVWFDKKTVTQLTFTSGNGAIEIIKDESETSVKFAPGIYSFQAHLNYAQAPCLLPTQLLKPSSHDLITQQPDAVKSLSFLCTSDKILAGAWRYFTYFGRDSMLGLLLLNPILSEGEDGAMETGLSAVLERINYEDGSVCHEENLGDYPAAQAALHGGTSGAEYDYKMVDTDFFLPILMKQYFIESKVGRSRLEAFLRITATLIPLNKGRTYRELLNRTCQRIMDLAAPFSQPGGSATYTNLIALKAGQPVGQWRDSNDGLGGGRYPYDVNTALMPAALRAIADLARAGAVGRDQAWKSISHEEAQARLSKYTNIGTFHGPSGEDQIGEDLHLQAVALLEDGSPVNIMHTDGGFRLLLLPHLIHASNSTSLSKHLTTLNAVADSILRPFPAGLYTPVGILIASPAYSTDPSHARNFTTGAYHGTVVWSWNSLVILSKGLETQLAAASQAAATKTDAISLELCEPDYYNAVIAKLKKAYTRIWETIEANRAHLSEEVWSWSWDDCAEGRKEAKTRDFVYTPLSHLPTPDGAGQTESNSVQLWSLTFLALERRRELEM
ncbi:MAG: hypothetical protein LQ352_006071 [Teloschistes flavicans]|nr:MAG: hypothetical protein LQ352_006071 [Teloschistes flavicans]